MKENAKLKFIYQLVECFSCGRKKTEQYICVYKKVELIQNFEYNKAFMQMKGKLQGLTDSYTAFLENISPFKFPAIGGNKIEGELSVL